jgi:hypothetical protein
MRAMFENFRQTRPVTFWVLVVGVAIIALWAVGSRIFRGARSTAPATVETVTGASDAQIQASASLEIARLQAQGDAQARADALELRAEELGVTYKIAQLENARRMNADNLSFNLGVFQTREQTNQIGIAAALQRAISTDETAVELERVRANRDVSLAITNAQVQMNSANNKTARKQSSNGLLGGIIGAIGGIFSDARLKENFEFAFNDPETGIAWYHFNYQPWAQKRFGLTAKRSIGVIAQDLLDTRYASAVSRDSTGFLRVNYHAIGGFKYGRLAIA